MTTKKKAPSLQQRVFQTVKSGQLVRTPGTPVETMSDFELTRFLVDHTPDYDVEYYLMMADRGARVEVSGVAEVHPDESEELIATLTNLDQQSGWWVRVVDESHDSTPVNVTIYDGWSKDGTRTDQ